MKRTIIVIGMCLALAANAQFNDNNRIANINPLRNGDGTFMRANNPLYYNNNSADTIWIKRKTPTVTNSSGDPFAFRIRSLQVLCNLNAVQINWTTIQQQADADHFEVEESADGGVTWTSIGVMPAARSTVGEVPYNFVYNKSLGSVALRVAAINIAGERMYSAIARPACSDNNLLSVDNLVYSTANVRIGSPRTQSVKMIITNQSGFIVQEREAGLTQGINSISLDMSNFSKGFYVLTIVWQGGRQESVKMVKK